MSLFQRVRRFFLTSSVIMLLTTVMTFGFGSANSIASTLAFKQVVNSPLQLATMNRVEAMKRDVEGKTQEAIGNVTGDLSDQMMGKAKQLESKIRNESEDIKEDMQLKGRAKAVQKNIEGKTQEAIGDLTDDLSDKASGQAKQVESSVRNAVEDVKDTTKSFFN
jgi:uncharacterized protein YjbJ (UPF0337 family)